MSIQAYFQDPGSCSISVSTHLACRYMQSVGRKSVTPSGSCATLWQGFEGTLVLTGLLAVSLIEAVARAALVPFALLFCLIADQIFKDNSLQFRAILISGSGALLSCTNMVFCARGIWEAVSGQLLEMESHRIATQARYDHLCPSLGNSLLVHNTLSLIDETCCSLIDAEEN